MNYYNNINYKYTIINEIGKGASSIIYKVYNNIDKKNYACKKISLLNSINTITKIINEINILELVSHDDSFIKIIEYFYDELNYYIILELADGNVLNYINESITYDEKIIKKIFNQIFNGIKKLHQINILHGDLKFDNILYVKSNDDFINIKICDFGLSKILSNEICYISETEKLGTLTYMAPEIFKGIYTLKNDIYSLGKMLYIIFTQENQHIDDNNNLNSDTKHFINKMLENNYKKRYNIYECINSKWIKNE